MLAQRLTKSYCRDSDACFARPFSEDFGRSLGPDIVLGLTVVFVEIVGDGLLQFIDALEDAAADALSGDLGKEALDHVGPRAGCGEGETANAA